MLNLEKVTDRDYNLIISEGGQHTPACKIAGHSLHAFSGKWPEIPNFTRFTKSNSAKIIKSTEHDYNLISPEGGQHTPAYKISGHVLHAFSGKCPKTPNLTRSLSQGDARRRKINRPWLFSNQFWRWSGYISACKISGQFLHSFSENGRKPFWTDGQVEKRSRLVGRTNGPMYKWREGISGFGRTDGQPENIMPSAPKGEAIKITADVCTTLFDPSQNFVVGAVFPVITLDITKLLFTCSVSWSFWQTLLLLGCGDTCWIWLWFQGSGR